MIVGCFETIRLHTRLGEGDGQNEGCDAQKRFKTTQGKRQGQAQVGSKTSHGEKSKVEGSARRRSCSQIQDKKTAATKSCGNQGFKEKAQVEDTIIDVIDEPVPSVVDVTEVQTIATANSTPSAA